MEAANFNKKVLENWWALLKHLSVEAKLELASRLISSVQKNEHNPSRDWKELYGAWCDEEKTAEEMIDFIYNSRYTKREIESFD